MRRFLLLPFVALLASIGCVHVKMDPIEVNANVTVNVKVDRALDDFFGDLDKKSSTIANPFCQTLNAMKTSCFRYLTLAAVLFAGSLTVTVRAEELGAVKARMTQRLSKLDSLKASGAIGENNRGLVEVRDGGGDSASVTAEENHDRGEVYAAIAKQAGSTADAVGRARAKQIAAASAPGVWLQHDTGTWAKK